MRGENLPHIIRKMLPPYPTDHEDARRYSAPDDRETDEEIRDRADAAAHRADHDNKCQKESDEGIELTD